jgi:hypothetical protein
MLVISAPLETTQALVNIMEYKVSTFPLKYLGMPLSNKKPTKQDYQTMIRSVQNKLQYCQATLLSSGGRLTLLNATLSTIQIFFMSTFRLPKWVIKEIDKIRKRFLWHVHKEQTQHKYMNPVSWDMIIRLKHMGGLGVLDLDIMNQALMAKNAWHYLTKEKL